MLELSKRTVAVFELINERLREVYVGCTTEMSAALAGTARPSPAPQIAHWNPEDVRPPRSIERDLDEEDARTFIEAYVRTPLPEGWRFLV
ncbi:MAG TPA: hypothetical protein VN915_09150 [Elusimicrobiota bacterium]|nr:hypothetical protein [Elusimicrobiota bacterium]